MAADHIVDHDGKRTEIFMTPGSFTWTCPSGVTSVIVECYGAGGLTANSMGGGGGGYGKKSNISVTPGNNYTVFVGKGTTNNSGRGEDSYFINNTTVAGLGGHGYDDGAGGSYVGDSGYAGGQGGYQSSAGQRGNGYGGYGASGNNLGNGGGGAGNGTSGGSGGGGAGTTSSYTPGNGGGTYLGYGGEAGNTSFIGGKFGGAGYGLAETRAGTGAVYITYIPVLYTGSAFLSFFN